MDLAPTRSLTRYLQKIGRGLRTDDGKENCIILDHSGSVFEHGLPDEPREWSLDGVKKRSIKKEDRAFPNRVCPACYRTHAYAPACPECGHVYEVKERHIDQRDGTLEQITAADLDRQRKIRERIEVSQCRTFAELKAIEKARGYKPGWAYFRWKISRYRKQPAAEATLL